MQMHEEIVGRSGLARILGVSESTTRNLEVRGEIICEAIIDGRPIYSVAKAQKLRDARDAKRSKPYGSKLAPAV